MEVIKQTACYHNFDNLDYKKFKLCNFEELKVGDIVKSTTMTYSQKYLMCEGYEDCNMTKIGVLLCKNDVNPENSIIYRYNFETEEFEDSILYRFLGSSGCVILEKYIL